MRKSVEQILSKKGLLRYSLARRISLSEVEGIDPQFLKEIPENASVIAIDQDKFRHLPEDEKQALCEAGYGICECEIWSVEPLDEQSISDLEDTPIEQNSPLKVHADYYVVVYEEGGKTHYAPLRKILKKEKH